MKIEVFNVFQDLDGCPIVLVKPLASFWLAVKFGRRLSLVMLSEANLARMKLVGQAAWEGGQAAEVTPELIHELQKANGST